MRVISAYLLVRSSRATPAPGGDGLLMVLPSCDLQPCRAAILTCSGTDCRLSWGATRPRPPRTSRRSWALVRRPYAGQNGGTGASARERNTDANSLWRAVGVEAPQDRVEALLKELEGKDIADVVASGLSKLASVPAGGAVAAAAPAAGAPPALAALPSQSVFASAPACCVTARASQKLLCELP